MTKCKVYYHETECLTSALLGVAPTKVGFTRHLLFIVSQLVSAINLRTKCYKWRASDRVCSAHFRDGHKYGCNNIPSIFPRRDLKTDQIVWSVDISCLLLKKAPAQKELGQSNGNIPVVQSSENLTQKSLIEAKSDKTQASESLQVQMPVMEAEERKCGCQKKIDGLLERIRQLEERREMERFGVRRFMASDSDMRFYTGLPDYQTFLALYNFLKPRPGFSLNYYNDYSNVSKDPSYVVSRGRPRQLCAIDELFLTMTRLRLGLLEKDLADSLFQAPREMREGECEGTKTRGLLERCAKESARGRKRGGEWGREKEGKKRSL